MPLSTPTFKPSLTSASFARATSEKITPVTLANKDTEYSHVLQEGVKELIIEARNACVLKFAFKSGESGTNYKTINPGCGFAIEGIYFEGKTLYLQASEDTTVVEIFELY